MRDAHGPAGRRSVREQPSAVVEVVSLRHLVPPPRCPPLPNFCAQVWWCSAPSLISIISITWTRTSVSAPRGVISGLCACVCAHKEPQRPARTHSPSERSPSFPSDDVLWAVGCRPAAPGGGGAGSQREGGVRVRSGVSLQPLFRYPPQWDQTHAHSRAVRVHDPSPADACVSSPPYIPRWRQASLRAGATSRLGASHGERSPRHSRTRTKKKKEYPEELRTERSCGSVRGGSQEPKLFRSPPKNKRKVLCDCDSRARWLGGLVRRGGGSGRWGGAALPVYSGST